MRRHLSLPDRGSLLVSADLHGNWDDFARLRDVWRSLAAPDGTPAQWVILGDLVHGPSDEARRQRPNLLDYEDRSAVLIDAVSGLRDEHPEHVHYVLGNHDHAHLGGPPTTKFHPDEAAHLEAQLDEAQRARLRRLFGEALLLVTTPCGAALCHGAPGDCIGRPTELDRVALPARRPWEHAMIAGLTTAYEQPRPVVERFLMAASRGPHPQNFVIHGHSRCDEGFLFHGGNQLCPVLFGAPKAHRRYVVLDLAARYPNVRALREDVEIRRLWG